MQIQCHAAILVEQDEPVPAVRQFVRILKIALSKPVGLKSIEFDCHLGARKDGRTRIPAGTNQGSKV